MNATDTIFALSSGKMPSGIAVFRLSGNLCRFAVETICGSVPDPRVMSRAVFRDRAGEVIDHGLCVYFPGPRSFTGEDTAELHVHGSLAVAKKLASALSVISGVRPAEAGEFTRRAFLNGKLDLAEVEGLSDLLIAETDAQRRLAIAQADGRLSAVYSGWRDRLVRCRAMIEASIDFVEEEDVQSDAVTSAMADLFPLLAEMRMWIKGSANSEIVRDGYKVVIIGAPNAGKSSLLNALAGRDAAIISDEPGTTRDLIDVRLELGGNLVIVTDTAGIRSETGKVEALGIERALKRAEAANLIILLVDASVADMSGIRLPAVTTLKVGNKGDLGTPHASAFDFVISAKTGAGVDALVERISELATAETGSLDLVTVQQRQKDLLTECCVAIEKAIRCLGDSELFAENLRLACDCIGRLTGSVDVEELLGVIFSRFCIGK